jgi:hypothetical protein
MLISPMDKLYFVSGAGGVRPPRPTPRVLESNDWQTSPLTIPILLLHSIRARTFLSCLESMVLVPFYISGNFFSKQKQLVPDCTTINHEKTKKKTIVAGARHYE